MGALSASRGRSVEAASTAKATELTRLCVRVADSRAGREEEGRQKTRRGEGGDQLTGACVPAHSSLPS